MSEVSMIGLDLAKHVFQVHGADALGRPVLRKRLRRGQVLEFFSRQPRCIVAMEACSGAHCWPFSGATSCGCKQCNYL